MKSTAPSRVTEHPLYQVIYLELLGLLVLNFIAILCTKNRVLFGFCFAHWSMCTAVAGSPRGLRALLDRWVFFLMPPLYVWIFVMEFFPYREPNPRLRLIIDGCAFVLCVVMLLTAIKISKSRSA